MPIETIVTLFTSAVVLTGAAAPASAATQVQDGLVNVAGGDNTITDAVDIGVAAQVAAQIGGVKVGPVAVLGRAVDGSGDSETVCTTDQGPVTLESGSPYTAVVRSTSVEQRPLSHVERREDLHQELRGAARDIGEVGGGGVPEHLEQHLVVHAHELEHADAVRDGSPADQVPAVQRGLVVARQVAQERGAVVALHVVRGRHADQGTDVVGAAVDASRYSRPSSRSSAV